MSMSSFSEKRRHFLKALALTASMPMAASATSPAAVSNDPAELAARSLLTAIAQAGPRLVACGERGHILLSDDGGHRWRGAAVPVDVTLTDLAFIDASKGWAVGHGGVILRTVDAGQTWTRQLDGVTAARKLYARAGGADAAARRNAERFIADGADKPFLAVHFVDAQRGFAVGAYGLFFSTDDGGENWEPAGAALPGLERSHLYAITSSGPEVLIAGEAGGVFRSRNRGESFARLSIPYKGTLFTLQRGKSGELVAAGLRGNAFVSANGGDDWGKSQIPTQRSLFGGAVRRNGAILLFDEAGGAWRSTDGGRQFQATVADNPIPIIAVVEESSGVLVVVGQRGASHVNLRSAS
ncbi:WD40/YVTN/BNR-like repeat-containing protein [Cupriavidus lacunae]|uniref:Glycosyl hydrolase n=1 Tax=Cupriavidus lacunae TaxID=2666307 RepID=A0A370NLU2_9BURK|nr:YCF48-related protein [Cupriavidus lacunae]RDK06587.1 glycosyl hydrolase [Cupriavidus lacunae]